VPAFTFIPQSMKWMHSLTHLNRLLRCLDY